MSAFHEIASFDHSAEERTESDPRLIVDLGAYEGPLDLLLDLARHNKVDVSRLSILALAEQYLSFIEHARHLRLELAADYLLMAAWLAFLKSKLLLPDASVQGEPSGEDMAEKLAEKLRRLEIIREAGARLMTRFRLGIDVLPRGAPEGVHATISSHYEANLVELLKAYATQRAKSALAHVTLQRRPVWSLAEARIALQRLIGMASEWMRLDNYLLEYVVEPEQRASVLASSFATSLELAREGVVELRQEAAFRPIYLRRPATNAGGATDEAQGRGEGSERGSVHV